MGRKNMVRVRKAIQRSQWNLHPIEFVFQLVSLDSVTINSTRNFGAVSRRMLDEALKKLHPELHIGMAFAPEELDELERCAHELEVNRQ